MQRKLPDYRLRRAVERIEQQREAAQKPKRRVKPKELDWDQIAKQGYLVGKGHGKYLAARYIALLERAWRGKPILPEDIAAACQWIEETALEEVATRPAWDSIPLTTQFYPLNTDQGRILDQRIWEAYQNGLVEALRISLNAYGCDKLRFVDMNSFLRYYRGGA